MKRPILYILLILGLGAIALNCGRSSKNKGDDTVIIRIDGSSTVHPIIEAVAEEFTKQYQHIDLSVGVSGTGGGFKKFCREEVAIIGASRPIKPSEEAICKVSNIEFIELPVAFDGIVVVVNKRNDWVNHMTVPELHLLWKPTAHDTIMKWNQVRPNWPDKTMHLFGPGVDSGTFDYFTKVINKQSGASRGDFTPNEDDNILVHAVKNHKHSLAFFGYSYYESNKKHLKVVPIAADNVSTGSPPIVPSLETISDGIYSPLSRPVFIYVNKKQALQSYVSQFVVYLLGPGRKLITEVGMIPLTKNAYRLTLQRFMKKTTGSLFQSSTSTTSVEAILAKPKQ